MKLKEKSHTYHDRHKNFKHNFAAEFPSSIHHPHHPPQNPTHTPQLMQSTEIIRTFVQTLPCPLISARFRVGLFVVHPRRLRARIRINLNVICCNRVQLARSGKTDTIVVSRSDGQKPFQVRDCETFLIMYWTRDFCKSKGCVCFRPSDKYDRLSDGMACLFSLSGWKMEGFSIAFCMRFVFVCTAL